MDKFLQGNRKAMLKEFRYNLNLFRQICCCFVLFFAFFSLFTLCGTLPLEVEFSPKASTLKSSQLADFPGDRSDDEAAVRWNYRCRTNAALRLDNRNNFRTMNPPQNNAVEVLSPDGFSTITDKSFLWHKQPLLTYYRRLWQKILPSRAGPCA